MTKLVVAIRNFENATKTVKYIYFTNTTQRSKVMVKVKQMYCCFLCRPSRHTGTKKMQLHSLLTSTLDESQSAKIAFGEKYDVKRTPPRTVLLKAPWRCGKSSGTSVLRVYIHLRLPKILVRRFICDKLSGREHRFQENTGSLKKKKHE
jgi:hypothetical protein